MHTVRLQHHACLGGWVVVQRHKDKQTGRQTDDNIEQQQQQQMLLLCFHVPLQRLAPCQKTGDKGGDTVCSNINDIMYVWS